MASPSSGWTLESLKEHFDQRINELRADLEGFPEHYALGSEVASLRNRVEHVSSDHIGRGEFAEALKPLRAEQERAAGRRGAFTAVIAVLLLATSLLWGELRSSIPSHGEITGQIQREAPWVSDRPSIESRIAELEKANEALKIRLAREESLTRFFCRTRTPQLPGC